MLGRLAEVRDAVLDRAALGGDDVLLDVGCGEGMIGFGALDRGVAHVVFSDVSEHLLETCRRIAADLDLADRCTFVNASADDLRALDDETVDVVTTRSVLIYVADKRAAVDEFFRVLRPGGRISLYEPINRFGMDERRRSFWGYPSDGADLAARVEAVFTELQPESDPMLDFDERDLVRLAEAAGFFPIELDYRAEIRPMDPKPWETFVRMSGNPKIPTIGEAMEQALTAEERDRLTGHLRPLVEEGRGTWRIGHAYLTATKPASPTSSQ
jgi:SAM-dependent methyltransferase